VDTIIIVIHPVRIVGTPNPLFLIYAIVAATRWLFINPREQVRGNLAGSLNSDGSQKVWSNGQYAHLLFLGHTCNLYTMVSWGGRGYHCLLDVGRYSRTSSLYQTCSISVWQKICQRDQHGNWRCKPSPRPREKDSECGGDTVPWVDVLLFFGGLLMLGSGDTGTGVFLVLSGIAIFGILTALRCVGHMVVVGPMPIRWIALTFWGFVQSSLLGWIPILSNYGLIER
jgi:hypothetical protein